LVNFPYADHYDFTGQNSL
jgi:cysteinyl-tRNA synthetase